VVGIERSVVMEGNFQITEELNRINRITRFDLKGGDDTLASAEISTAGDIWIFSRIFVSGEHRANGYGSDVLIKLIEYLDRNNIDLYAYIYSSGSLSEKHLDAWYRRYGFVDTVEKEYPLARYAGGSHCLRAISE
jgi:GNAT superfamily N-acetyltransferase